jgi:hypothetical protein
MSKATFYRIPVKPATKYAPLRRQRVPVAEEREQRHHSSIGGPGSRPTFHPAPQFRRNRRFWLRRLALAKAPR